MNEHDGGPAFPSSGDCYTEVAGLPVKYPQETAGMTLRDYFAAKIAAAIFGSPSAQAAIQELTKDGKYCQNIASASYRMADFMLEARKANTKHI